MTDNGGEINPLLGSEMHKMSIEELIKQMETSLDGMATTIVKRKRTTTGDNTIPPPLNAPAWLCCLLPCLLRTKSMEQYKECVPHNAQVKRSGRAWVNMEATGILPGDLIKVSKDERVAADIRIIEANGCTFDTSAITGKKQPQTCNSAQSSKEYVESPNMAFCGFRCLSGECTGIVVATGADTVMGKMINKSSWPPKGYV